MIETIIGLCVRTYSRPTYKMSSLNRIIRMSWSDVDFVLR